MAPGPVYTLQVWNALRIKFLWVRIELWSRNQSFGYEQTIWLRICLGTSWCNSNLLYLYTYITLYVYMWYTNRRYIEITSLFGYESVWVRVDVISGYYTYTHALFYISLISNKQSKWSYFLCIYLRNKEFIYQLKG